MLQNKIIIILLLLEICNSYFYSNYINRYNYNTQQYNHNNNNNNNNYITNEIPQTYQEKLSSSLSTTTQKLVLISSFVRLLQPSIVNALTDIQLSECSDSIVIFKGNKDVILIGTAHISEESANLVRRTVRTVKPDLVMIELDSKRIGKFSDEKTLNEAGFILPIDNYNDKTITSLQPLLSSTPSTLTTEKKQISGFSSMISGWASRLGGLILGKALGQFYGSIEKLGFSTGGEFKAAVEEGLAIDAKVLLGDRDVDVTLQRLAKAISLTDADSFTRLGDRLELVQEEIGLTDLDQLAQNKELAISTIELMKNRETLSTMLQAVKQEVPLIYNALIGERDIFMANSIANAKGKVVVGVVGMAHMFGMEKSLTQQGYTVVKRNCPTSPKLN